MNLSLTAREVIFGKDNDSQRFFGCTICCRKFSFGSAEDLVLQAAKHMFEHATESDGKSVECPLCVSLKERGLSFYSNRRHFAQFSKDNLPKFSSHLQSHHQFCCTYCPGSMTWEQAVAHLKSCTKFGNEVVGFESEEKLNEQVKRKPEMATPEHIRSIKIKTKKVMSSKSLPESQLKNLSPKIPDIDYSAIPNGTIQQPTLFKVVKTKASPGRWYTPITFIFNIEGRFYHVRKDGVSKIDRDNMYMRCNNGAVCPWTCTLKMKDRFLKQTSEEYFNRASFQEQIKDDAIDHSVECKEKAMTKLPSNEEAASLPQNVAPLRKTTANRMHNPTDIRNMFRANAMLLKI